MSVARDVIQDFAVADLVLLAAGFFKRSDQPAVCEADPEDLVQLAEAIGGDAGLLTALEAAVHQYSRTDRDLWQSEHTRLFEATVTCPVNETAYVRRDKGVIIGDICGFYNAFGFEPGEATGEKADHIVCEMEFVAALLIMLGQARRVGNAEHEDIVTSALKSFLQDHLGEWIGLFCQRLQNTTNLPLHVLSIDVLHATWDVLAVRFDLPAFESLDDQDDEENEEAGTPYECDMADSGEPQLVPITGPPGSGLPQSES